MLSNNHTSEWLHSLPQGKYDQVIDDVRKKTPNMSKQMKERQQQLYNTKLEALHSRQAKKQQQQQKQHTKKIKLTQSIQNLGGIWTKPEVFDAFKVACVRDQDLKEAIVTQLQLRKHVLGSTGPRHLFQQQHKGKSFSIPELSANLMEAINLDKDEPDAKQEAKLQYREEGELASEMTRLKKSLGQKVEENRQKVIISQQKEMLQKFVEHPETLVGKTFKHKCKDPESNTIEWFAGKVLPIYQNNKQASKTEYQIKYDGTFHFLETWKKVT